MKNALIGDTKTNLPGSGPDLMQQAKRLGVAGRSSMSVPELRDAVGEALKKVAAPRGGAAVKMRREMAAQQAPDDESVEPAGMPPVEEIAEGEPAPQQGTQGDFDSQLAELSALLSQVGAAQAPGPVANAVQSGQVAQAPDPWQSQVPQNRLLAGR